MPLPSELARQVLSACVEQGLDPEETQRALAAVLGGDRCLAYRVWVGPGFEDEDLRLDVNIVGERCVYSLTVREGDLIQASAGFADVYHSITLWRTPDPRSPWALSAWTDQEHLRIFGSAEDLSELEEFRAKLVALSLAAKNKRA